MTQLANDIESDNEAGILSDGIQLIEQIGTVVTALEQIGSELNTISGSLGLNPAEVANFAANLAKNLLSLLLISYLRTVSAGTVGVLNALGVVRYLPDPGVPGSDAPALRGATTSAQQLRQAAEHRLRTC